MGFPGGHLRWRFLGLGLLAAAGLLVAACAPLPAPVPSPAAVTPLPAEATGPAPKAVPTPTLTRPTNAPAESLDHAVLLDDVLYGQVSPEQAQDYGYEPCSRCNPPR